MKGLIGDRFLKRFSGIFKEKPKKDIRKNGKPGHEFDQENTGGSDACKDEIILEKEEVIDIKDRNNRTKID